MYNIANTIYDSNIQLLDRNMGSGILILYSMMTSSNGNIFRVTGQALCAGNSPVPVNSTAHRPVTRSFDVFFDLRLNKRLSKQPWGWWFDTPSWSFWYKKIIDIYENDCLKYFPVVHIIITNALHYWLHWFFTVHFRTFEKKVKEICKTGRLLCILCIGYPW